MRADRLITLVLQLQKNGRMTSQSLAETLDVSQRTIFRDVEALSQAGIPIYAEGGHGGGIALDEQYRTSLTMLQESEILSLFINQSGKRLQDIGLNAAAENAALKLYAALPTIHKSSVDYLRQRVLIDPDWWWPEEVLPFWNQIQTAVYEDRRITASYERRDGTLSEIELEPYSLISKSSYWYLVACRSGEGEFRTYRVSRFRDARLLEDHFERQPDFDLYTFWQQHLAQFNTTAAGYEFSLRVRPNRLNFIHWIAPGRHQIEEPESSEPSPEWLTVHLQLDTFDLAKMLVFGLAQDAEVIAPQELYDAVVETARHFVGSS
jgi:predicted DNA-binding transcriptional regulator YafY